MFFAKNAIASMGRLARRKPAASERRLIVTCPVCFSRTSVQDDSDGLEIPDVSCRCGSVINGNLSFYLQL